MKLALCVALCFIVTGCTGYHRELMGRAAPGESAGRGSAERPDSKSAPQEGMGKHPEAREGLGISKRIPGLSGSSSYVVYYGTWSDEEIGRALAARLVIGNFDRASASREQVQRLKAGSDGIAGSSDDVTVIAYLSPLQERDAGAGALAGNGEGPLQIKDDEVAERAAGFASYYVDALTQDGSRVKARVPDGKPDRTDSGTGYRVNPADPAWRESLESIAREVLVDQGADGLFLDVLDAVRPGGAYSALIPAASDTVKWLSGLFPEKYLIANRGFFLFESDPAIWYSRYNISSFVSAVMLENHYTEWDYSAGGSVWSQWAGYPEQTAALVAEAEKDDGFQVLVLDYVSPDQADCEEVVERQRAAVLKDGRGRWMNLMASIGLDQVGFEGCRAPAGRGDD